MNRIIKRNDKLERFELPRSEAIAFMEQKKEPYKVELINDLPSDARHFLLSPGRFHRPMRGAPSAQHGQWSKT
jgi:threonyl-tRNA synthetase